MDLALGYDLPVYKASVFFVKATFINVFNHQMINQWNTTGTTSATGGWVAGTSYGRPASAANYNLARTVTLAGGIRF